MKKLAFLLIVVVATALSSNVFGQSTGTTPAPGATQNYYVTNNGNEVLWTVTKGNLDDDAGSDAVITTDDAHSTDIKWDVTTAEIGTWYYVHVLETNGDDGCSNEKVLPVQITASPFFLTLEAAKETSCYNGAVSVSLADPSTPNYDHGNTTIVFTVTPTDLSASYTGYTFDLDLTVPTGYTPTVAFSTNASLTSGTVESGTVTVTDNSAITITYTVDNENTYTNAEAVDVADFTATAEISNGVAINGVSDNGSTLHVDETEVSRIHTSGIGSN